MRIGRRYNAEPISTRQARVFVHGLTQHRLSFVLSLWKIPNFRPQLPRTVFREGLVSLRVLVCVFLLCQEPSNGRLTAESKISNQMKGRCLHVGVSCPLFLTASESSLHAHHAGLAIHNGLSPPSPFL